MDLTQYFGVNTFNDNVMKERLPLQVYRALKKTIENGEELSGEIADVVGYRKRCYSFYSLVPAHDGRNCRKARFIPCSSR